MTHSVMQPPVEREPVREIARFDPFESMSPFGLTFGRLFDDLWGRRWPDSGARLLAPALDVEESPDAIVVSAEIPGIKKEDVKIRFENDVLSISGEKKWASEKKGRDFFRAERRYGAFHRDTTLPCAVNFDAAEATFRDGVLEIRIPKREDVKPKTLKVK